MITDPQIEAYIRTVRAHLGSSTASEEEEVVRAINSRVQELAEEPGVSPQAVLEQLGPAKKLAHHYRDALLITKAGKSKSPTLLLRASARNGLPGILAFVLSLAGYWVGGIFMVYGILALVWSIIYFVPGAKAAIGLSVLQCIATVVAGAALIVLTTILLRALLRSSKRVWPPS